MPNITEPILTENPSDIVNSIQDLEELRKLTLDILTERDELRVWKHRRTACFLAYVPYEVIVQELMPYLKYKDVANMAKTCTTRIRSSVISMIFQH